MPSSLHLPRCYSAGSAGLGVFFAAGFFAAPGFFAAAVFAAAGFLAAAGFFFDRLGSASAFERLPSWAATSAVFFATTGFLAAAVRRRSLLGRRPSSRPLHDDLAAAFAAFFAPASAMSVTFSSVSG